MRKYLFILLLVVTAFPALSQTADSIPAKEAINHYNQTLKVYSTVSGSLYIEKSFVNSTNVDWSYPSKHLPYQLKD